jgi:hypothetical protein
MLIINNINNILISVNVLPLPYPWTKQGVCQTMALLFTLERRIYGNSNISP